MIKKILLVLASIIVLIIAAAVILPIIYKDEIRMKVETEINKNVNANVSFDDFDIGIIRSFPNLSFNMDRLIVAGVDSFSNDTLANIKQLFVVVDLMSVINGETIKIRSVDLEEPNLHVIVLPSGRANWDIAKADTTSAEEPVDTTTSSFSIALKSYSLKKAHIIYDDRSLGMYAELKNTNHKGSGDFTQDLFTLVTQTETDELTVAYGGVPYLNKVKAKADAPIEMDMKNSIYTFKQNEISLNNLLINFDGSVAMPDTNIDMDLKFDAQKSDFKNFLSLIPAIYSSSFDKLEANGKFALKGYYKGRMNAVSSPGFGVDVLIENGNFKYPDLPTGVNNVQLQLNVDNADGIFDHMKVDMKKLHMEFGSEPFDATLLLKTPESDPDIDAMLKGTIDLSNIIKIIPLENTELAGIIKSDVSAKGKMSTIEKGNYDSFDAKGNLSISNFKYSSKESPLPLSISNALFVFNPRNITLSNLSAKYGKSDFQAAGSIENYLAYALKGKALKGKLDLKSSLIDLNEMMGPESEEASSTPADTAVSVFEVPKNIDFTLTSSIKKVLYDNMEITDLGGAIIIRDQKVSFDKVALNTLDAQVKLDGYYSTVDVKKPEVNMNFGIQGMDIQKAFKTFNTVQKLAPIAERTSGKVNGSMSFATDLAKDMSPIYPSVQGKGFLEILNANIKGSKMMNSLADAVKVDKLRELNITNTKLEFSIENGRVVIKPFDLKAVGTTLNIGGSSGLDQTIDYKVKMNFPKSFMGGAANNVLNNLAGQLNKNGADYKSSDMIGIDALVGGIVSKPTVKLSMADAGSGIKNAVKDVIDAKKNEAIAKGKEEARKKADQLLTQAQKQADVVKSESKNLAEKARKEGYAAADKVEQEAKNPVAKAAAKKIAEKMRKESDDKAKKIEEEGNKRADGIMNNARSEADKLLK